MIEVGFKEEPRDDKPEPLRMEHFYLPLGMWFVGLLISLFCFIAEFIINRGRKSTTKLEEPRVIQTRSTPESGAEVDLAGSENIEDINV